MEKIISAGIVIFNEGGSVLLGHPTNAKWDRWNIPKGRVEPGESMIEAALRETKEETGISYLASDLKEHGMFEYIKTKNLYLFSIRHDVVSNPAPYLPDVICTSLTEAGYPEFDNFAWVRMEHLKNYLSDTLQNIVKRIEESYKY